MIIANPKYITKNDIEEVLKLNPKEDDLQSSFVTDGKFLYYVDGYTNPQEIRALSEEEQFQNLSEIANGMNMTKTELIDFMLDSNIRIAYDDGEFSTEEESKKYWKEKEDIEIFKGYDKYMGIAELIADVIGQLDSVNANRNTISRLKQKG